MCAYSIDLPGWRQFQFHRDGCRIPRHCDACSAVAIPIIKRNGIVANHYDIVIIGAGLVGSSMALALAPFGLNVAVLEKNMPTINPAANLADARPLTLSAGSQRLLARYGVWSDLAEPDLAKPYRAIEAVHVSQQGRLGRACFRAQELNVPALGYVVSYDQLLSSLFSRAKQHAELIEIDTLAQLETHPRGASVTYIQDNARKEMTADLLIAADGTESLSRHLMGIQTTTQQADAYAVIVTLGFDRPLAAIGYQRFIKEGTLGVLPLVDQKMARVVWTLNAKKADEINTWSDQQFMDFLQQAFGSRLGHIQSLKRNAQFPLQTKIAEQQMRDHFLLIGNAAHTIYPIAAQGFNLGLRDVSAAASMIRSALRQQSPLGAHADLARYVAARKPDQTRTIQATVGIAALFDLRIPLLNHARGLGLLALDMVGPLKRRLGKQFIGAA